MTLASSLKHILMTERKDAMVNILCARPDLFDEAIRFALADEGRISWRAAWVLWACMEPNDVRIKPYLKRIIGILPEKAVNHQRELMMILQRMVLGVEDEGRLFDVCAHIWIKSGNPPSVRHNALRLMASIAQNHPALIQELQLLTEPYYLENLSPGVKRSIQKILSRLSTKKTRVASGS